MRADQLLVQRGLASSRSQSQRLIASGLRWFDGVRWRDVAKNGDEIPENAQLEIADASEARYVSRGGLKLEGALTATGVSVSGRFCLDVGQSTGGFTDCLLQQGAARVVGVDVGHAQVHERVRGDERVVCIEGVNAREMTAEQLQESGVEVEDGFDLVVGDLSFISLTLVLPAIVPLMKPDADMLMLVKPQFELQPGQVGKGGVVRDESMYPVVEKRIRDACEALELSIVKWMDSPIQGGDGNREFFIHAKQKQ